MNVGDQALLTVTGVQPYGVWLEGDVLVLVGNLGLEKGQIPADRFRKGDRLAVSIFRAVAKKEGPGTVYRGRLL